MIEKAKGIVEAANNKMQGAVKYLEEDLKTYRAGKANPAILNGVTVIYYGSEMPIDQVASVTIPDAKTILIQPWERNMIPVIEKAILAANIGLTPSNNGEHVRLTLPPLTEDRRKELLKKVRTAGENAKVVIRNARRDAIDAIKKTQKEGLAEDLAKDFEEKAQKATDTQIKAVDVLVEAKEKEILTV